MKLEELKKVLVSKEVVAEDFNVEAYRHGVVEKWGGTRQSYLISVINNGVKRNFVYYDSIHAYRHSLKVDVVNALQCIVGDAIVGSRNYDTQAFMREFGYESCSEADRVLRACTKTYNKLLELFDSDDSIYVIDEAINNLDLDLEIA